MMHSLHPNGLREIAMEIHVTEHKSIGKLNPVATAVRVFVDRDYRYGYFVPEDKLFELLNEDQQAAYLQGESAQLDVPIEVAEKIVELGHTPYAKQKLR